MKLKLFLIFLFYCSLSWATHYRAGEITYTQISGRTYNLRITIYTKNSSNIERCDLTLNVNGGDSVLLPRVNGPIGNSCGSNGHDGVILNPTIYDDTKMSIYESTYTFKNDGKFRLTFEDKNRNGGVNNISNSDQVPFYIDSYINVGGIVTTNSSPQLQNPPVANACLNTCYYHNPGAVDPDGDSLVYSMVSCLGQNGNVVPGYQSPSSNNGAGSDFINRTSGLYSWCAPNTPGEYNIAILVEEYRKIGGFVIKVGETRRDMQINVQPCSNRPPTIQLGNDTCIIAGGNITRLVTATDPDLGDLLDLTATGLPNNSSFFNVYNSNPANSTFTWNSTCDQVRNQPYYINFIANDNVPNHTLFFYKSLKVNVLGPPVTGVTASAAGNTVIVNWTPQSCPTATTNKIIRYHIYRKENCDTYIPQSCQQGLSHNSGFTLIGKKNGINSSSFTDNNNGLGLSLGSAYTYAVTAIYYDGSESVVGLNSIVYCIKTKRSVPLLLNVSVTNTDASNGTIFVRWAKPLAGPNNLDTLTFTGPYIFKLYRSDGINSSFNSTPLVTVSKTNYYQLNQLLDSTFTDANLNTVSTQYKYKVDFYSGSVMIGNALQSSSIYLNVTPTDNINKLVWNENVSWINGEYAILRSNSPNGIFTPIDTVSSRNYTDSNLVNGVNYCYYIISKGAYPDSSIYHFLYNNSQIVCATPIDNVVPCQPKLNLVSNCTTAVNTLNWNNPNLTCSDDVVKYNLYYSPTDTGKLVLIDSLIGSTITSVTFSNMTSVAGCYAITAVDTFKNESIIVEKKCNDNCPYYELPNVFTPNGDEINDIYFSFPYRFIKDIEISIYNRWGQIIYTTTDLDVKWDGKNQFTKKEVPDGVYFYLCKVNEIRLQGIVTKYLKGYIEVFQAK